MKAIKLYVGLDVHKDSITIAIAEAERNGEIRLFGSITNDLDRLEKALIFQRRLRSWTEVVTSKPKE